MKNEQKEIGVCEIASFITRIGETETWEGKGGTPITCRKVWLLSKYSNQFAEQKDVCIDFYKGNTDWPAQIDSFGVNDLVCVQFHVTSKEKPWTSKDGKSSGINYQHWLTGKSIKLLEKGEPEPEPAPEPEPEQANPEPKAAPAKPADSGSRPANEGVWDDDVPF